MSKEKLYKRSDGFVETPEGLFAVYMLRKAREVEGVKEFSFKPSYLAMAVAIQWQGDLAYLPADTATALVSRGYARNPTEDEVKTYSGLMAQAEGSAGAEYGVSGTGQPDQTADDDAAADIIINGELVAAGDATLTETGTDGAEHGAATGETESDAPVGDDPAQAEGSAGADDAPKEKGRRGRPPKSAG